MSTFDGKGKIPTEPSAKDHPNESKSWFKAAFERVVRGLKQVVAFARGVLTARLNVNKSAGLVRGVPCFLSRVAANALQKSAKDEGCAAVSRATESGADLWLRDVEGFLGGGF